jgi:hypothetical protein
MTVSNVTALKRAAELAAMLRAADAAEALAAGYRARPPLVWDDLARLRCDFDRADAEARRIGAIVAIADGDTRFDAVAVALVEAAEGMG